MKKTVFILFTLLASAVYGQKPTLTLESQNEWAEVIDGGLSNDGQFAFYTTSNSPVGQNTFTLKTTGGKELFTVLNLHGVKLSKDSRYLFGMLPGDTLLIYGINKNTKTKIANVSSYDLRLIDKSERLVYKTGSGILNLCNYTGKPFLTFEQVSQFQFSPAGNRLMIQSNSETGKIACRWVDTNTGVEKVIYTGKIIEAPIFDLNGKQLAFLAQEEGSNNIFYYKDGADTIKILNRHYSAQIDSSLSVEKGNYWAFSNDGKLIFFSFRKKLDDAISDPLDLQIWNYKDAYLRSYYDGPNSRTLKQVSYLSTISTSSGEIRQLISDNQHLVFNTLKPETDSVIVVQTSRGMAADEWNPDARISYSICMTRSGLHVPIVQNTKQPIYIWNVSPTGKYVVYFDPVAARYISYDVAARKQYNITPHSATAYSYLNRQNYPNPEASPIGIAGWLENDKSILINSTYDILQCDPTGKEAPINITSYQGEKNKLVFFSADGKRGGRVGRNGKLLLTAFDTKTKNFGFYNYDMRGGKLQEISMGKRYFKELNVIYRELEAPEFFRSPEGKGFLVRLEKADQSPNYYFSKDLVRFKALSDVKTERKYNWLTTELCNYKDSSGQDLQGVLYKPENFNPTKKYPIIFYIYESKSDELNMYRKPDLPGGEISIPLFVSNGYLVFLPDIKGRIKYSGDAALSCVMAATDYLSAFSWVDTTKMGIVGHSVGGFETNYIITHTNKFAAALSGGGVSNMINVPTDLWGSGENRQWFAQYSAYMNVVPLSEDPDTYIRNSPILYAKRLSTPVLFLHNDNDGSVTYLQTQSFFITLRSLGKPCWWLNYRGMGHGVGGADKQFDYNTKVWQFFDHYLKDKPMPDWMKLHN